MFIPTFKRHEILWQKIIWLIHMRWGVFFAFSFLLLVMGLFPQVNIVFQSKIVPLYFVTIILGVFNFLLNLFYSHYYDKDSVIKSWRIDNIFFFLVFFQVFIDYSCVTILITSFGFMQFNLTTLYLPHIIISAIIFERKIVSLCLVWLSLLTIFILLYTKPGLLERSVEYGYFDPFHHPLAFGVFITIVFHVIFYLTNILSSMIAERRTELLEMNEQLISVDMEKQNFTLRATHELKAPFAAIQSYIKVIKGGYVGEVNPKIKDIVDKIDKRCSLLSKMIKDIIQLSNLRTSIFEEKDYQKTSVLLFIKNIIEKFSPQLQVKKMQINFSSNFDEKFCMMLMPELFEIALDNLITNSIRYSLENTAINIKANKFIAGNKFTFSITDEGIGIPEENIDKIFDEHFRSKNAVNFCADGNGMGLAIVKQTIELHSGKIYVFSELGKGTEFIVNIPLDIDKRFSDCD